MQQFMYALNVLRSKSTIPDSIFSTDSGAGGIDADAEGDYATPNYVLKSVRHPRPVSEAGDRDTETGGTKTGARRRQNRSPEALKTEQ